MLNFSKKNTILILITIILFSLAISSFFYIISDFYPLLSDTARTTCGVRNLVENKSLNNQNFYLNFAGIDSDLCWSGKTYLPIRILASAFSLLSSKISPWISMYLFYLIVLALIPLLVFLIAKKLFNDDKIALVSAFFGGFAPFLARSVLVHPQNLVGFVLILFFILIFIQHHLFKKYTYLVALFLILIIFPYFHHLSFFVLLISLVLYLILTARIKHLFFYFVILLFIIFIVHFFISKFPLEFFLNILNSSLEGGALWESSVKKPFWEIPSYLGYLLFAFGFLGLIHYSSSNPERRPAKLAGIEEKSRNFISDCSRFRLNNNLKTFFFALFLAPLIFSQLYFIGINFFSFRIIAYIGIPLIIFSGLGFFVLKEIFSKFNTKKLFFYFSILIFLSTASHYFSYLVGIYKARNIYYIPQPNFIKTVKWLNDHSNKKTVVLTTVQRKNKQTVAFAYLYKGNVIYFPAEYFKDPKNKNLEYFDEAARSRFDPEYLKIQPKHLLGKILLQSDYFKKIRQKNYQNAQKNFTKLKKLHNFMLYPEKLKTQDYDGYKIYFVVLKKDSWADKIYQRSKYKTVFENQEWRIYYIE